MTEPGVTVSRIADEVFAVEGYCEPGVDVRALLLTGHDCTALIDTFARPSDLAPVAALIEAQGRPLVMVNSHADWDHWWGNAAFPDAPVVAHRLTLARQQREGRRALAIQRRRDPERFAGVKLRAATVTFEGELDLDLGDLTVQLRHLPGHTHDCIVAYIPQRRLLFAGDTAENPIPLLNEGAVGRWPDDLLWWADRARTVVPAHGPIAGRELLERNALYLESLTADPGRPVAELEGAEPFYRRAHRRNLKRALS